MHFLAAVVVSVPACRSMNKKTNMTLRDDAKYYIAERKKFPMKPIGVVVLTNKIRHYVAWRKEIFERVKTREAETS
jgi:hypothetical protein